VFESLFCDRQTDARHTDIEFVAKVINFCSCITTDHEYMSDDQQL